jgi:hypothetical protein
MEEYGVVPQRISPLMSLSGHTFEEGVEGDLGKRFRTTSYAALYGLAHNRPDNNSEVVREARNLLPGQAVMLCQARLEAQLAGWRLRGDVDLLRLERSEDGTLCALVTDMKSTVEIKVEHRLQVAFYRLMLERLFKEFLPCPSATTAARSTRAKSFPSSRGGTTSPPTTPRPTRGRGGRWKCSSKESIMFYAPPCPRCGENAVRIALYDLNELVCVECDSEFSLDDVRQLLNGWTRVLKWIDLATKVTADDGGESHGHPLP